ncbi:MAG: DUF4365 domain-containing protein [Ktedonobacterales bacterium]|nr:DUF4365 domain-containing protein [Ktedonobacterales bacterium]
MAAASRKPFQHIFNELGESQVSACFQRAQWSVTKISADYGQDFLLHPFHQGEMTGKDGYIQLKSTDDVSKYGHKQGYQYRVKVVHLRQWQRILWPVFLVLWDITRECGYWVHIQPVIAAQLAANPQWLTGAGMRTIPVPATHMLQRGELGTLPVVLDAAYRRLGQHLEQEQQVQLAQPDPYIAQGVPQPGTPVPRKPTLLPLSAQQLAMLARLQTAAAQAPQNWRIDLAIAKLAYERDAIDDAFHAINAAQAKGAVGIEYLGTRASILTEYTNTHTPVPRHLLVEATAIFAALGAQLAYPPKVHNDYNHGNALKALGYYEEALLHYDDALSHDPDALLAGQVLTNKGVCLFHLGRHEEEYAAYAAALQRDPMRWQALSCWAATEVRCGQPSHAQHLLLEAFARIPAVQQMPAEAYALAYASYQCEDFATAAHWAQHTVDLRPEHRRALRLLALSLSHLWRSDLTYGEVAVRAYQQWLASEPQDMFIVKELYLVYRANGADAQARELVGATKLTDDASTASLFYYGSMLADEGHHDAAIRLFEQAQAATPERYIVHRLGHLYQQQGWYRQAISCYAELLPEMETTHLAYLADCFAGLHDYATCILVLLRLLTLQSDNARWWSNLRGALAACEETHAFLHVQYLLTQTPEPGLTATPRSSEVATVAAALKEQTHGELCIRPWTQADVLSRLAPLAAS